MLTSPIVTVSVDGTKVRVRTNPPETVAVPIVGVFSPWSGTWNE
jgi:hypothetical protein